MVGNNKANPVIELFQGIETLKDEFSQLRIEVKNDNWRVQGGGQQEILIVYYMQVKTILLYYISLNNYQLYLQLWILLYLSYLM